MIGRRNPDKDKSDARWFDSQSAQASETADELEALGDKRGARRARRTARLQEGAADKLRRRGNKS